MNRTDRAQALRRLHQGLRPLVLPNAWDVASARLVVNAGFPVVATSSGAITAALAVRGGRAPCATLPSSGSRLRVSDPAAGRRADRRPLGHLSALQSIAYSRDSLKQHELCKTS